MTYEQNKDNASVAVVIGRWQIPQLGHATLWRKAFEIAPRVVIAIGSAYHCRDCRNPFTWAERQEMLESVLTAEERSRVSFLPVRDFYDDERWEQAIRSGVEALVGHGAKVTLVGYKKDHTSAYLDQFPGWDKVAVRPEHDISSTDLRHIYFGTGDLSMGLKVMAPYIEPGVRAYLAAWANLPAYRQLVAEEQEVKANREQYPDTFKACADALIEWNDHILMVRREGPIGAGFLALPGGHVEPHERFYDTALRELEEETGFKLHPELMKLALKDSCMFDHPLRDVRGRYLTEAFYFKLTENRRPEVHGRSDAREALWVPRAKLLELESQLFADHPIIIDHWLPFLPH